MGYCESKKKKIKKTVLQLIFGDQYENVEAQIYSIVGTRLLRDYIQKPSGFFADHMGVYSKSKRYAPIYWPLSAPSGSYTIWLYYHRLTDQTLYTCVNELIDHKDHGKLTQVTEDLNRLRTKLNRSSAQEKELERLSNH
jgi:hypothetical protein